MVQFHFVVNTYYYRCILSDVPSKEALWKLISRNMSVVFAHNTYSMERNLSHPQYYLFRCIELDNTEPCIDLCIIYYMNNVLKVDEWRTC